jgi:mRNA-degrading endonuclease toxin of MazEF toxin-antitoxin module
LHSPGDGSRPALPVQPGPAVHRSHRTAIPTAVTSGTTARSIMYATVVSPSPLIG